MDNTSSAEDAGRGTRRRRDRGPAGQRFSTVLKVVAARPDERITIADLTLTFGDRAFGAIMLIFALLSGVPLPPGSTLILGVPIVLVAGQLAIGRHSLWLPAAIGERSIRTSDLRFMVGKTLPSLRRAERFLAPRLSFIFGGVGNRVIGVICLILALLIFLPIPFGNLLPALSVACFALALLRHDGLAALLGAALAVASVIVLVTIYGAVFLSLKHFLAAVFS